MGFDAAIFIQVSCIFSDGFLEVDLLHLVTVWRLQSVAGREVSCQMLPAYATEFQ